jgi:hypothetical protein
MAAAPGTEGRAPAAAPTAPALLDSAAPVAVLTVLPLGTAAPVAVLTLAPLGTAAPVAVFTLAPLGAAAPVAVLPAALLGIATPGVGLVVLAAPVAPVATAGAAPVVAALRGAGRRTGVIGGGVGGTRVGVGGVAGTFAAACPAVVAGAVVRPGACAAGALGDTLASSPAAWSAWQTDQPWPPQPVCSHQVQVPSPATGPLTMVTWLPGGTVAMIGCSSPGDARTFKSSSATTVASVPASCPGGTAPAGPTHASPSANPISAGARTSQRLADVLSPMA